MPRYRLDIEYDGAPYAGWQRQNDQPSVQGSIERILFDITGEHALVQGAGRTDAGVHARGQVGHVSLNRLWAANRLREALNAHLKMHRERIAILEVSDVEDSFDARHSASKRIYCYKILNRRPPPALQYAHVWHVPQCLDVSAMQEAAQHLLGYHDFTTFRALECQAKSPMRHLDRLEIFKSGDDLEIWAEALSFLHRQVRSIVGSLKHVGTGLWAPHDMKTALEAKTRSACGQVAPAHGLCLERVEYRDKQFFQA